MGVGGAERVFIEQANALVEQGYRCTLVLFELDEAIRPMLPADSELIVLGDSRYADVAFLPKLWKLAARLRRINPDCVVAHQSLHDYLRWALLGTGIPYFLLKYTSIFYLAYDTTKYSLIHRGRFENIRGSLASYVEGVPRGWSAGLKRRVVNETYALRDWLGTRSASRVFTLTSRSRWELQQLYGIDPVVWTPGSSPARTQPAPDAGAIRSLRAKYGVEDGQPVVLSVNRLEYRKRVGLIVRSMRLLTERQPRPKLVIVGDGEEREGLEAQAKAAGIGDQIVFAGLVDEVSLAQHYHMCNVAVAVIWGSWALTVVEPLLYNKNTVISNEIPDLLDGVPNIFRATPEPEAVARAIEDALATGAGDSFDALTARLDWHNQNDVLLDYIRLAAKDDPEREKTVG